jgi:hypothetical protein
MHFDQPRLVVILDEPRFVMLIKMNEFVNMKTNGCHLADEADEPIFVILTT